MGVDKNSRKSLKSSKNEFIKILLIFFFVFILWVIFAINAGNISKLWSGLNDKSGSLTGEAVVTSCVWSGKSYAIGTIFWDSETTADKYVGCKFCNTDGSKTQLSSCQQTSANGDCRVFWQRNKDGLNFVGSNNTVGFASSVNDKRFVCLNNIFYECGWELNDSTLATKKAEGNVVGSYKCDLANKQWISNSLTCTPNCSCSNNVCVGNNCSDGCGGFCQGSKSAICPSSLNVACGVLINSTNECGTCPEKGTFCESGKECINNSCLTSTTSVYYCNGIKPQLGSGTIIGLNYSNTQLTWQYDNTISAYNNGLTSLTACKWKCAVGYTNVTNASFNGCIVGIGDCNTNIGCKNYSIANAGNVSGNCQSGYSCYACNSGYSWNSNTKECRLSVAEGTWSRIVLVENKNALAGYRDTLGLNEAFQIIVLEDYHYVAVVNISSTKATINVSSTPQQRIFEIGNESKFDLDSDGVYDLSVKLNSISSNVASLTIKVLEQSTSATSAADTSQIDSSDTGIDTQTDDSTDEGLTSDAQTSGSGWLVWVLVIMVIAVIGAIVFVYFKKFKNKNSQPKTGMPPAPMPPRTGFPPSMPPAGFNRPAIPSSAPKPGMPVNPNFKPVMPMQRPNMPLPVKPGIPPAKPAGK